MRSGTKRKPRTGEISQDLGIRAARSRAEKAAGRILRYYGVESADHIMLEAFAGDQGAPVTVGPLDGAVARLVRVGSAGRIRVSDAEKNEGRRRFSVAHELGHFVLEHSSAGWVRCAEGDLQEFGGASRLETEANFFATELLLPESLVEKRCDVREVSLRPVVEIAEEFRTSITSTAIRFVGFCPEACAVLLSCENRILWSVRSPSCWCWTRAVGDPPDSDTEAGHYYRGTHMSSQPEVMDSHYWLQDRGAEAYREVVEHSMPIPSMNAVLTMVWVRPDR